MPTFILLLFEVAAKNAALALLDENTFTPPRLPVFCTNSVPAALSATPIPTPPLKYALPVVVAPPEIVKPPACVELPMVDEAKAVKPPLNCVSVVVALPGAKNGYTPPPEMK